jgi:hypothetical protein
MDTETIQAEALALLRQRLAAGECVRLTVGSRSMAPALLPGDSLTVSPFSAQSTPSPGTIVMLAREEGWVAHRVRRQHPATSGQPAAVVTRGDNCPEADPPCPVTAIIGLVVAAERQGMPLSLRQSFRQRCRQRLGAIRRWFILSAARADR